MSGGLDKSVSSAGSESQQQMISPKKSKRLLVPVTIAVAIVLILAVAWVFVVPKKESSTPAKAFQDYADAWEKNDSMAAFNETVYSLGDLYDEWYDQFDLHDYTVLVVRIESIRTIYNSTMTEEQRTYVHKLVVGIQWGLDVQVEDACLVNATIYETYLEAGEGHTETITTEFACVKVDSRWYVVIVDDIALNWWGQATTPGMSLAKNSILGGFRFTIVALSALISWDDLWVSLQEGFNVSHWELHSSGLDSGNSDQYSFPVNYLGDLETYLTVIDLGGNGQANAGDYFELLAYNPTTLESFTPGVSYTFMVFDQLTGNLAGQMDFVGE